MKRLPLLEPALSHPEHQFLLISTAVEELRSKLDEVEELCLDISQQPSFNKLDEDLRFCIQKWLAGTRNARIAFLDTEPEFFPE